MFQWALIVGLVVNRSTRIKAEAAARDLSRRLIHSHEEEHARLARELHDDVTQRLARLAIDTGRLDGGTDEATVAESIRSIHEGLVNLSEDVHALSYQLHPTMLKPASAERSWRRVPTPSSSIRPPAMDAVLAGKTFGGPCEPVDDGATRPS